MSKFHILAHNSFVSRIVIGSIGPTNSSDERKIWNELFAAEKRDAFFDFYRTTIDDLPLRLSEMYVLQRRGYIVSPQLGKAIISLLDETDGSDVIDTVVNEGGVLKGYAMAKKDPAETMKARYALWFASPESEGM